VNRAAAPATKERVPLRIGLALLACLAGPLASAAPPHADEVTPSTQADRAESAHRRTELATFQKLLEDEHARPTGARIPDPVDRAGHRVIVLVETPAKAVRRVDGFDHALFVRSTFVLVLDAQGRLRFLVIEPEDAAHEAYEIDAYLFDLDGRTVARDHTYGTSLDCADGRLHERRIVTAFRPNLRMISRAVEFANDFGAAPRLEGCALHAAEAPLPDAPSLLRAHGLEPAAAAAGVMLAPGGNK